MDRPSLLGWRVVWQWCVLAVTAFYPIMLNTAKNVRTTVEALERPASPTVHSRTLPDARCGSPTSRISVLDLVVLLVSAALVVAAFPLGARIPWLG